jgi:thiamine biosynthesis lipoprotein
VASLLLALVACAGPGARAPEPADEHRLSRIALGTLVEITVREADPAAARAALEWGFVEIARLEGLLSTWREDSELSALNRAAGDWRPVSQETGAALDAALAVAAETDGAFEPTIRPLLRAWGFEGGAPRVPSDAELRALRGLVDFRRLERQGGRARLAAPGMGVSLGGIGKGFIADAVLRGLRERGIPAALVAASGDLACYGGTGQRPWPIAVEDPDRPGEALARFDLREGGVSTSAPTWRAFESGGERYHHLLDPRSGRPARGTRSLTVVSSSATRADALSTALFVMGKERALAFARSHPDALLVALFDEPDPMGGRFASAELGVRWELP